MNLNTRHLGVDKNGIFVKPTEYSRGSTICHFCHLHEAGCDLEPANERCEHFVPALAFVPPLVGLEGRFSTFRPSSIWYDRARRVYESHGVIGLVNASTSEKIGIGRIVDAHRGSFADLMREHAWSNHLVKDKGMSREQAAAWLIEWIRRNMGSMYARRPEAIGTVIYVERET